MNNFLDLKQPSTGQRPTAGGGNSVSGGAINDFLNRPSTGQQPSQPAAGTRPAQPAAGTRPSQPAAGTRPSTGNNISQLPDNRPSRVENRQELANQRQQRHAEINDNMNNLTDRQQFWADHPNWARWRVTRPYRWATAAAIGGWYSMGSSAPVYYDYGENIYYEGDAVYQDGQQIATAEEYADQAQEIATSAPESADNTQWMPLGVFALTQEAKSASAAEPTIYLQLVLSKEGVLNGTVKNMATEESQEIEGAVDKESQRAAWVVSGKTSPIMETGIYNLTKDDAPALLHFADGQTQQWLMVRLDEPADAENPK